MSTSSPRLVPIFDPLSSRSRRLFSCLPVFCADPPSSPIIYPKDEVEDQQQNTLICYVTGFYPAPVNVSWTKNEQKVTVGPTINTPYPNKDGSFTQVSRLDFIPRQGDIYSCTVEHPTLTEPLTQLWGEEPLFRLSQQTDRW
uniref:Ig-like domain-containing protein n=1 Tax=Mola mola TaxID=94237 RepID=A0A3Q3X1D3_MOLML